MPQTRPGPRPDKRPDKRPEERPEERPDVRPDTRLLTRPPTRPGPAPRPTAPAGQGERRVVCLHARAPAKPPTGTPCNGCGLCCATEPCPIGMLLSRRRRGACAALHWSARERRYLCGALAEPARWLPWLPAAWTQRLVRRWIAAGVACDADLEVEAWGGPGER